MTGAEATPTEDRGRWEYAEVFHIRLQWMGQCCLALLCAAQKQEFWIGMEAPGYGKERNRVQCTCLKAS